jgi:hypothetical protein
MINKHCIWNEVGVWVAAIGNAISSEKEKQDMKELNENKILMILRKYTSYLVVMKVQVEKAVDVIRQCSKLYKVSKKYADELILSISIHQSVIFESLKKQFLTQRNKRLILSNNDSSVVSIISVKLSVEYVEDVKELRDILLLNKAISAAIKFEVLKEVLLRIQFRTDEQRLYIWHSILECVFSSPTL